MPETLCGFNNAPGQHGSELLATFGPTLLVDIGFDAGFRAPPQVPGAGIRGVSALVDTGAAECCIDARLAVQLALPIVDRMTIAGSSGPHEVNVHLAQIHIPSLTFTIYGRFAAVDLAAGGQMHLALIGRTFLKAFTMIYEGPTGTVRLSRPD